MSEENAIWALGLMSGTSMDGVDAALLRTDGEQVFEHGPVSALEYDDHTRSLIRSVLGGVGNISEAEEAINYWHVDAIEKLLSDTDIVPEVIGFHGQTILHEPAKRKTWQLGDGAKLAARIGIDVINDLRGADVAAGGQGAPFAPLYHAALAADFETPLAVLNIGGVSNVTWIGDSLLAFDTGPGNALMDDIVLAKTGEKFDRDGVLAAAGNVDNARLKKWLTLPFFSVAPPKSLDRNDFDDCSVSDLPFNDGLATLAAFTVATIARAKQHFPGDVNRWLVTGGGRHNGNLMMALRGSLGAPVDPVEAVGWRGDALEAEAFAFLSVRSLRGLPLSVPGTTGVPRPTPGGRLHRSERPG